MSGVATAIVGSAVIGGVMSSNASADASSAATGAQDRATAYQYAMYDQTRKDFGPYRDLGEQGVKDYQKFNFDPSKYLDSPAYQWQAQQLDKNMNRQLSARGRSNSSYGMNTMAQAYGNLGAQEYNAAYGRETDRYNRALDPIKIGQGAASSTGQAAQGMSQAYGQAGTNLSNIAMNNGNNQASLYASIPNVVASAYKGYNAYNRPASTSQPVNTPTENSIWGW